MLLLQLVLNVDVVQVFVPCVEVVRHLALGTRPFSYVLVMCRDLL